MIPRTAVVGIGLAMVGSCLLAQVPPEERIPITDPNRLEKLRLPRDARNVFEWAKLDRSAPGSADEKAAASSETWGTQTGYTTLMGYQLQAGADGVHLNKSLTGTSCYSNEFSWSHAQFEVPEGARLAAFRSWAYDSDSDRDLAYSVWESCQPYGYDPPTDTLIAENSTLGSIGYIVGTKSLSGLTANNEACAYTVRVDFAPSGEDCHIDVLRVLKLQVLWSRQVSPAPATATFNDVPTDHPFFPFVEALAKSGITGGCGGGNYCPDTPLTRGQMAVFLAKGLGLEWP